MSILSKASLVQIPSGYGEDKLYSEVPNTTAGDFTFTRASTGTRVNADGYIEEVPWNLITYSEDFSNSSYIKDSGVTIGTTNNVSPIGNNTATQIDVTDSGRIYKNVTSDEYRTSVYLKAGTFAYFKFVGQQVDLNLGTISSAYPADIEDVGNGWYRISISYVTSIRPWQIQAYPDDTYTTHTTSGNYFVWGAMLNYGDTTKPYIKTTDRLNVPRLDYSGGASCPTLLLEPQRTNEVTYSSDYSTGWAKSNAATIANDAIGPSGLEDASKIYPISSGNYRHIRKLGLSPSSGLYTFSIFAKAGELDHLVLIDYDGSGSGIDFDLTNGVATDNATSPFDNVDMIDYGDGWYRCVATATNMYFYWILSDNGGLSVTANGTDGLYIWGAMAEQGSYPTSYIPTSGTSVTRVKDESETSGLSSLINSQEGVLFLEIESLGFDTQNRAISIYDGISTNGHLNRVQIGYFGSDQISFLYRTISGNVFLQNINVTQQQTNKFALKYKENDFSAYINGVKVAEQSSGSVVAVGTFTNIATHNGNNASNFFGKCKQLIYFNEALTDTELEALTTI